METHTQTETVRVTERPKQKYTPTHRLIRFKWWVILMVCSTIFSSSLVEAYRRMYGGVIDGNLTIGQRRTFDFALASTGLAIVGLTTSILPYKWCTWLESLLIIAIVSTYAVGSVLATTNPEPPGIGEEFVVATRKFVLYFIPKPIVYGCHCKIVFPFFFRRFRLFISHDHLW